MPEPVAETVSASNTPSVDELLRHLPWLQRLARSLIPDRHQAEDLVQETLHAAIRTPPRERGRARAWLGTVARRSASRLQQVDRKRRARETRVAKIEAVADKTVIALEAHRRLTEEVLGLCEPYRSAIVMRYYRQLEIAEIARLTGSTETNVRTRLGRAIGMLRARLGADRRVLCLAVLGAPLQVSKTPRPPWPLAGPLSMKKKTALVSIAILIGAALPVIAILNRDGPQPPDAAAPVVADVGMPVSMPPVTDTASPRRVMAEPPSEATDTAMRTIRCRVLDAHGNAVPGAQVLAVPLTSESPVAEAVSQADGIAELSLPEPTVTLQLRYPHATLRASLVPAGVGDREFTVVAADPLAIAGTVHAEDGSAIEGALLAPKTTELIFFPLPQDSHLPPSWARTRTDADGQYRLSNLPHDGSMQVEVSAEGYRSGLTDLLTLLRDDGQIILQPVADPRFVYGTIRDAGGLPVAGATVGLERFRTESAADGSYRLRVWSPEDLRDSDRLYAGRSGFAPLVIPDVVPELRAAKGGELRRDMVLAGEAHSLAGVVQRGDGSPVGGLWVLAEGTYVDRQGTQLEALGRPEDGVAYRRAGALTDEEGRFNITGLRNADYQLTAVDPDSLGHVRAETVRAGRDDIEITWPDAVARPLRGHVVDDRGTPVVGLELSVYVGWIGERAVELRTDAQGRFAFDAIPTSGSRLITRGSGLRPEWIHLDPEHFDHELELRLQHKHYLQVVLPSDHPARKVSILSESGEQLTLSRFDAIENWMWADWELRNGRTTVLSAPPETAAVVLKSGNGEELKRIPVTLVPGEVVVVR